MSIFNNNSFNPFGTNNLFDEINKTNQQINSMNLPQPKPQNPYRQQNIGNMLLAFSDVVKGRDPSAGVMQRKTMLDAQKKEAERKAKLAQYKENNPGMVGMLEALEAGVPATLLSNKDSSPASVKEYQFAIQEGYKGSFQDFLNTKKQSTNINLNQGNLGKLGQELAASDYKDKRALAADANSVLTSVDTLENLLNQGVSTGFGSNVGLSLQRIGQTIIGEDYKVPEIAGREAFQAETTKLILPLVKQLGVNPTDKDLDFVKTGAIELSKSEAGNRLMIASLRLSMNRRIDEANFNANFFANPNNENVTIYARDIAFEEHKKKNPELYTSASLQEAYDNLLFNQASNNDIISTDEESPF